MLLQEVFHTVYRRDKLAYCFLESFIAEKIVVMIRLDVTRKENINKEILTTVLVVEQNAKIALELSSYAYIMESGKIVLEGKSSELKKNPDVKEFYMGLTQMGGRKSFKDVKSYKRRKRWM